MGDCLTEKRDLLKTWQLNGLETFGDLLWIGKGLVNVLEVSLDFNKNKCTVVMIKLKLKIQFKQSSNLEMTTLKTLAKRELKRYLKFCYLGLLTI